MEQVQSKLPEFHEIIDRAVAAHEGSPNVAPPLEPGSRTAPARQPIPAIRFSAERSRTAYQPNGPGLGPEPQQPRGAEPKPAAR